MSVDLEQALVAAHGEVLSDISETVRLTRSLIDGLRNDNARLRALIKGAEWSGATGREGDPACPWCSAEPKPIEDGLHAADCPAFTPDGEVK